MTDLTSYLQSSISDFILNKQEKQTLRSMLASQPIGNEQLNQLRSKMFDLAATSINEQNYKLILEWVRNTGSALNSKPGERSYAHFSPGETCRQAINTHINSAKNTLKICVFTISDDMITQAILAAHRRGVDVQILTDNDKLYDKGSDIVELKNAGIVVKVDNTSNHMHHKFLITDDSSLITGSYNWTRSAAKFNHENIIVSTEPALVKDFIDEFGRLWKTMGDYMIR